MELLFSWLKHFSVLIIAELINKHKTKIIPVQWEERHKKDYYIAKNEQKKNNLQFFFILLIPLLIQMYCFINFLLFLNHFFYSISINFKNCTFMICHNYNIILIIKAIMIISTNANWNNLEYFHSYYIYYSNFVLKT